jgi:hypothetical protein
LQAIRLDRLEEVVDRVDVERLDGVLVVRRDEHELGLHVGLQEPTGDLEAGQPGHLHVQQDEVGPAPR